MRGTDYEFIGTDAEALIAELTERFREITGYTVQPGDPERLIIAWLADAIIKERVNMNFTGNMNIPSRATGEYLDALGEWLYGLQRHPAAAAKCTVRFTITPAETAIPIPQGTRVTDPSKGLVWQTTADALIPIGDAYIDVMVQCAEAGEIGNGYIAGQINTLIDVDNILYFVSCANTDTSAGGAETESDDEYAERMRLSLDAYSTAGSEGAYIYHAKSVSDEIADVRAVRPTETVTEVVDAMGFGGTQYLVIGAADVDKNSVKMGGNSVIPSEHGSTLWVHYQGADSYDTLEYKRILGGTVYLYVLMNNGSPAGSVIKSAVLAACNAQSVRPLTDKVEVKDPESVSYNITLTYYIPSDTTIPLTQITAAVENAVNEYKKWQSARLGRDINPSKLWQLLMQTGIKRAVITAPTYTVLRDGTANDVPQIAACGTVTVTNGGYEDE